MELTAYKLFNRMLQQKISPIPETYQALLDATSPMRASLVNEVKRKLHQSVQGAGRAMQKRRRDLLVEARTASVEYLRELSTDDPAQIAEMNLQKELERLHVSSLGKDKALSVLDEEIELDSPKATLYVGSLRKAFYGNEWERAGRNSLTKAQRDALRPRIEKLSDMEVSMFLSIHRQKKADTRSVNIDTVLNHIHEGFIYEMLKQRDAYLTTLKEIMEKNNAISEYVTPYADASFEEVPVEVQTMDTKHRRRRLIRTKKKVRKNKAEETKSDGTPSSFSKTTYNEEILSGSVQEGVQLRGTYKTNFVKLAKEGDLWTLPIKKLKQFENGEDFKGLQIQRKGTKAEHIKRIEVYLFGDMSNLTSDSLLPNAQYTGNLLDLRDISDEEGNTVRDKTDQAVADMAKLSPFSSRQTTFRFQEAPGGRSAKMKIPQINNPTLYHTKQIYGIDKNRIPQGQKRLLNSLGTSSFRDLLEDRLLREKAEIGMNRKLDIHPYQKYTAGYKDMHTGQRSSVVRKMKKDYEKQAHDRTQLLSPLRKYAEQIKNSREGQNRARGWSEFKG